MTVTFTVAPQDRGYAVCANGQILQTPGKHPLVVPTGALAEAIASEWVESPRYNASRMKLTALAYTAIDRIAQQKDAIIEVLLAYVDTDTLSYRSTGSQKLAQLQDEQWDPVLARLKMHLGATWEVTNSIMPIDQPQQLHDAVARRFASLEAMELAAACMLASGFSSLALTLAVLEGDMDAAEAFRLSRLEEESQAEQWGRDEEAERRASALKDEIIQSERFLRLLDAG